MNFLGLLRFTGIGGTCGGLTAGASGEIAGTPYIFDRDLKPAPSSFERFDSINLLIEFGNLLFDWSYRFCSPIKAPYSAFVNAHPWFSALRAYMCFIFVVVIGQHQRFNHFDESTPLEAPDSSARASLNLGRTEQPQESTSFGGRDRHEFRTAVSTMLKKHQLREVL